MKIKENNMLIKSIGMNLKSGVEREATMKLMNDEVFPTLKKEKGLKNIVMMDFSDTGFLAILWFDESFKHEILEESFLSNLTIKSFKDHGLNIAEETIIERAHKILSSSLTQNQDREFIQIFNYMFKGTAEKESGIQYLEETLIANETKKEGFLSYLMVDGGADDVFVLYQYEKEDNIFGASVERQGFKNFVSSWARQPFRIYGLNQAS